MKIIHHGSAKMEQINLDIHAQVYLHELAPKEYILVDCAYSNSLINYTNKAGLDFDLIKLVGKIDDFLIDIDYDKITVLLTHFHPDHIGELNNLKNCIGVYCNLPKFQTYRSMNSLKQKDFMFLHDYFSETPHEFHNALVNPVENTFLNNYFENVYDIFGDNEVLAVNLPGHVNDQLGYYFPKSKVFYIGDSVFTIEDIEKRALHPIMVSVAKDLPLANTTLQKLVQIHLNEEVRLVPTHFKK
jgi:glyoxylase-like metal-dependent hydrolase (beta-lactamase superfamily II)